MGVSAVLGSRDDFHQEAHLVEKMSFSMAAILGMRRAKIAAKFDEIVAFAEVERFIDMPVKRYSSGMYLRLAFSVAAFLESEICSWTKFSPWANAFRNGAWERFSRHQRGRVECRSFRQSEYGWNRVPMQSLPTHSQGSLVADGNRTRSSTDGCGSRHSSNIVGPAIACQPARRNEAP